MEMPLTRIHKLKISENVPEKYEESEYDGTVDKLFQRIILLMKISGIFVESRSSSKAGVIWHFSCWIYCVLLASMFLADSGRFMLVYKTEEYQKLSNRAMGVYAMTVFTWVMPVMSIGNLYLLTKHVPMILEALSSYDTNYSFEVNKRTLNRTRKRMVYGIAIHSLFGTVFLGLLLTFLPEGTIIMTMLVGFQYSNYTQKIVPIVLMSFKVMILTIGMSASSAFNHWLMKLIKSEYSKVTSRLTSLIQEKSFQEIEEHVEDLRKQHEALTALLQTANPVLQFAVLLSYASGIPVVCFLLYGLADGGLGVMDTFVLLEMFMGSLMSIIYLTLMGATLNSNSHEVKDVLFQLDLNSLSEKTIRQVDIFIARVNGPAIGISVYNLFIVDGSSILMIFGTILTYSIVIFQTTGPTECNCNTPANNSTFI